MGDASMATHEQEGQGRRGRKETNTKSTEISEGYCWHVIGRHQEKEGAEAGVAQTSARRRSKRIQSTRCEEASCCKSYWWWQTRQEGRGQQAERKGAAGGGGQKLKY